LNIAGRLARDGLHPHDGLRTDELLEGRDVIFRSAHPGWNRPLFGYARWFTRSVEPRVLQIVWPDADGKFPGEPGCYEEVAALQPDLTTPPTEHPPGAWRALAAETEWFRRSPPRQLVLASRTVMRGERPVLAVFAPVEDEQWVFGDGDPWGDSGERLASYHLIHVLRADPTLEPLVDLPPGSAAYRDAPSDPWEIVLDPPESS
jgi:hypothetical protein